jgi:hypothetical protein
MTSDLFLSRHEKEWEQIKGDLVSLVDASSPAHQADKLELKTLADLNHTFAASVAGYAACRRLLNGLGGNVPVVEEDEPTFTTPPQDAFRADQPPSMPAPRLPKAPKKPKNK